MTRTKNPWPGPLPYPQDFGSPFCGRNSESEELAELIRENVFVTLYGKSGVGKTSIINMGVIPILKDNYKCIRLELEGTEEFYAERIINEVVTTIEKKQKKYVEKSGDAKSGDYLWEQFLQIKPDNSNEQILIILDQFEKALRSDTKDKAATLLTQLFYIVRNVSYFHVDFYFHFVISIREDDLYLLEDCIDMNYLYDMKNCRYRLHPLSWECAKEVITIPGAKVLPTDENEKDSMIKKIIELSTNSEDGSISSIILSLVCRALYEDMEINNYSELPLKNYLNEKSEPMKDYLFERYYIEATIKLNNCSAVREFIEDKLVMSERRVAVPIETAIENRIDEEDIKQLISSSKKLLNETSDGRIELIHDAFCPILAKKKANREKEEREKEQNTLIKLYKIRSLLLAEKANNITDAGDSYTARLLAIEALPFDWSCPNIKIVRPIVEQAVDAYKKAVLDDSATLYGCYLKHIRFIKTKGAHYIVAENKYNYFYSNYILGRIYLYDVNSGAKLQEIHDVLCLSTSAQYTLRYDNDHKLSIGEFFSQKELIILDEKLGNIVLAQFSPDDNIIALLTLDGRIVIKGWKQNVLIVKDEYDGTPQTIMFSDDSLRLAVISIVEKKKAPNRVKLWTIRIWNLKESQMIEKTIDYKEEDMIVLSPDLSQVAVKREEKKIVIFDTSTLRELCCFMTEQSPISGMCFSPDGRLFATASESSLCLWDLQKGEKYWMVSHQDKGIVKYTGIRRSSISFSNDGNMIASTIGNSVIVWKTNNGKQIFEAQEKCIPTSLTICIDNMRIAYICDNDIKMKKLTKTHLDSFPAHDLSMHESEHTLIPLKNNYERAFSLFISSDSQKIIIATGDKEQILVETELNTEEKTLRGHTDKIVYAVFSPDNTCILTASYDYTLKIWDASTLEERLTLKGHNSVVISASYSYDGSEVASISSDGIISIWNANTGENKKRIDIGKPVRYHTCSISYSSDKQRLLLAYDTHIVIIDVETGNHLKSWDMESWNRNNNKNLWIGKEWIRYAIFSRDNSLVIVACEKIYVIAEATGVLIDTFNPICQGGIRSMSINKNNELVVVSSKDISYYKSLIFHVAETRHRFMNRPLTKEERKKYYLDIE